MELMQLGGWMMWPLLAVSMAALTIIVERGLIFLACPFPNKCSSALVQEALRLGDVRAVAESLGAIPLLKDFAHELCAPQTRADREAALRLAGEAVLARLETRLALLALLARLAPLMGLLGTILGMIRTFSHIAGARAGVDMAMLAGGIWQALLTTAAGLMIAIPSLFFLSCFRNKVRRVAFALNQAGNVALMVQDAAAGDGQGKGPEKGPAERDRTAAAKERGGAAPC